MYMSKQDIENYAKQYSQSYGSSYSPWKKQFDEMAQKTVLRRLLTKYGVLTTEFEDVVKQEEDKEVAKVTVVNAALEQPPVEAEVISVDTDTGEVIEEDAKAPF